MVGVDQKPPLLTTTDYRVARRFIENGDVLLFRRPDSLIAAEGRNEYSHAGRAVWHGHSWTHDKILLIAEMREWVGGRIVPLSSQVRRWPGAIDVYRPRCAAYIRSAAADFAMRQAGHPYNYSGIVKCAMLHRLGLRRFVSGDKTNTELSAWYAPKFCSQCVVWCDRAALRKFPGLPADDVCPVPKTADWCVEPSDLVRDSFYDLVTWTDPAGDVRPLSGLIHRGGHLAIAG